MPLGPMGHVYDWRQIEQSLAESPTPSFAAAGRMLYESGKGKISLPFIALERLLGQFPIHEQTIGDCVSHGFGTGIDVLQAVEIQSGENERWVAETATESIYAISRVERGKRQLGRGDGSVGAWAADAVSKWGVLQRIQYDGVDLRQYSGQRAKAWGWDGLPDILEPKASPFRCGVVSLCDSYEQARDAIANGYPVAVCSNEGFEDKRDADGFARPSGSWAHCMVFVGADDTAKRPGLLCMNSWGKHWISGPKRHGQPDGSFWVDADIANRMLARNPDSWALGSFSGYPGRNLDYLLV
jgi:hypothetical protein